MALYYAGTQASRNREGLVIAAFPKYLIAVRHRYPLGTLVFVINSVPRISSLLLFRVPWLYTLNWEALYLYSDFAGEGTI